MHVFTNPRVQISAFTILFSCIIIFAKSGNFHKAATSKDSVNHLHLCLKDKERIGREERLENENK